MSGQLPGPALRQLSQLSPTRFESLKSCRLSVAFDLDPSYAALRKERPGAALGTVCHQLIERAAKGQFNTTDPADFRTRIDQAWADQVAAASERLAKDWPLDVVPTPKRWPRYELARVRTIRLMEHLAPAGAFKPHARLSADRAVRTEIQLESKDSQLVGRADRVEIHPGGVRVIDFKTSASHSGAEGLPLNYRRQLLWYAYLWWESEGAWPKTASIQYIDGDATSIDIDPEEATTLADSAREALLDFNRYVGSRPDPSSLAKPDSVVCRYCPYKGACQPFLEALAPDWWPYNLTIAGRLETTAKLSTGRSYATLHVTHPIEWKGRTMTVVDVLSDVPSPGSYVSFVDLAPAPSGSVRVQWDSQVLNWDDWAEIAQGAGGTG